MEQLIANYYVHKKHRLASNKDFNVALEGTTRKTLYIASDDDGATYYFAGNPLDNWIKFGGYYWRIIRINGDGTIRLIYQGKESDGPQTMGTGTQIETSVFNLYSGDNKYAGYFYEQGNVHGISEPSTIYNVVNNWYNANLRGKNFEKYIDRDAGFCNDRQPSTNMLTINNSGGTEKIETRYASAFRLKSTNFSWVFPTSSAVNPTFKCTDKNNDLFTTKASVDGKLAASKQGNRVLENPIGLITADEAVYAGFGYVSMPKKTNYLYTGEHYWAMTPHGYMLDTACINIWRVTDFLTTACASSGSDYGVRPVINLRSDVKLTGNGTASNPYEVVNS